MTTPFDFLNSINDNKKDLFEDPQNEKEYAPFLINKGLSYFPDTILYANEMNQHADIPKKWQFDFLRFSIPKRRRFSKWHKKEKASDILKLVMKHYKYSEKKAYEIIDILSDDNIKELIEIYHEGGRN